MFQITDSVNIWVAPTSPAGGDGSVELPFNSIEEAVSHAVPGSRIVLMPGEYDDKVSLREVKGQEMDPISIMAFPEGDLPVVCSAEWFLYGVSDLIIEGITFRGIGQAAISMVGEAERNIIKSCFFDRCGSVSDCTLFLGGSSGKFNVIEECTFIPSADKNPDEIAIFVAQSYDLEDDTIKPSSHSIIRYCTFENFGVAIVVGSGDLLEEYTHHSIEENVFTTCGEGVRIKAPASVIKDNIFRHQTVAIKIIDGEACEISGNRFEACPCGIEACAEDATIFENCFIDSPVVIATSNEAALPVVLYHNTHVGRGEQPSVAVSVTTGAIVAITDTIFAHTLLHASSAIHVGSSIATEPQTVGAIPQQRPQFLDATTGDYRTELAMGCHSLAAIDHEIMAVPRVDFSSLHGDEHGGAEEDATQTTRGDMAQRDLYLQQFFHDDETIEEEDNAPEFEAMSVNQQPLRPIGEDGELEDN